MKKQITKKKLELNAHAIRVLTKDDLREVAGGQYTYDANETCGFCKIVIC